MGTTISAVILAGIASSALACPPLVPGKSLAISTPAAAVVAAKEAWMSVYSKAQWQTGYSSASVARFEPYSAMLKGGIWYVSSMVSITRSAGGAPVATVCAVDGTVEAVSLER